MTSKADMILDIVYNDFFHSYVNKAMVSLFFPAIIGTELVDYDLFHHIFLRIYNNYGEDKILEMYEKMYERINYTICNIPLKDLRISDNFDDHYYIFNLETKDYLSEDYSQFIVDKEVINDMISDYPQIQLLAPLGLVVGGKIIFRSYN